MHKKYKSFASTVKEMNNGTDNVSQYRSLTNVIRSIYNRQIPSNPTGENEADLQQIQNRKIQNKLKIIDNT